MQGSLSEFRLAEILQLVAVQQKTGLLRLARGTQIVTFYFERGVLVSTLDRRQKLQDPLVDFLLRTGYLQAPMVDFLRMRVEESKEDLTTLLQGERFLNEEELRTALEDLAQELVHKTFTWREGTYQFIAGGETLEGIAFHLKMKIDGLLMEGARRADEWPRLVEKLPGPDVLLDAVSNLPTDLGGRPYEVLNQLQEVLRLGELVRRSRVPEFEVYEIVAQAVDAGIVRILEKPEPVKARQESAAAIEPRPRPRPRKPVPALLSLPRPLGWSLALLVSLLSLLGAFVVHPRLTDTSVQEAVVTLRAEQARETLRLHLEVYRCLQGRYPSRLEDLEIADLASAELLRRAEPLRYTAAPDGRSFHLGMPAPVPVPAP